MHVGTWLLERPIAHRGLHSGDGACPENSLAAFGRAVEKGYAIELDLQRTADGRLAVFHDDDAGRMTGVPGAIRSLDSAVLRTLRLLGSGQTVPMLEDVLGLVGGAVPLLIEIKNRERCGRMEDALNAALSKYRGPAAVQSFNPFSVRWFRVHAPHIQRGLISGDFRREPIPAWYRFVLKRLLLSNISCPHFINYDIQSLPNRWTESRRRRGIPIIGWTARSVDEYRRALRWCDNVVFEGFDPAGP